MDTDTDTDTQIPIESVPARPMLAPTIELTVGGILLRATLAAPPSLFALACGRDRRQIEAGGLASDLAYGAAALLMCWPAGVAWPAKPRPRPWAIGQQVEKYGSAVWEGLRAVTKGDVPYAVLSAACYAAHNYAVGEALTEDEIKGASDFSEGQEEG